MGWVANEVYVIQLKSCNYKKALGALYVGSSWYDPSERMRRHDECGETGAVGLRGQCRRLRPELYLDPLGVGIGLTRSPRSTAELVDLRTPAS
jgi:hypothetical protein